MKISIRLYGLLTILFAAFLLFSGCSKSADKVGIQPADIPPNEAAQPSTSNDAAVKSDITKQQQSREMPMPGQANDHSTLDSDATQKSHK